MSAETPWADLTSAQRLDVVLLAIDELEREGRDATASRVAMRIERTHPMELAGWGNNSRRNGLRRMSTATRVTPAITSLRKRGLIRICRRTDGYSGSADIITPEGDERVRELKPKPYFEIGPESRVYHTRLECPALNRPDRYWPVHEKEAPTPGRRLCGLCERAT